MRSKRVFHSEAAYFAGLIILVVGTAFMEKADLGMSMVVAPAYLIYRAVSRSVPAFTFGMAEYIFQAVVLIALSLVMKKAKKSYLFSFVTALIYGVFLDLAMKLVSGVVCDGMAMRILFFLVGVVICAVGIAFLFHTYITPGAYELFVKEIALKFGFRLDRLKTVYDCSSCLVGVILSFIFFGFGHFEGVKLGTVFCALVNGWLIGRAGALLEKLWDFKDAFPLRRYFDM